MILFPAIDLLDKKVVRLLQGRYDHVTEYSNDPMKMAEHWKSLGAKWLHIVDLDGARTGKMENIAIIKKIAKEIDIWVQVGGGIRDKEIMEDLLDNGIKRIILGTSAIKGKRDFLQSNILDIKMILLRNWNIQRIIARYTDQRLAVSLDCSNGFIAERGWTKTTNVKDVDLALRLNSLGVKTIIYTDIAKDGTLEGPNFQALRNLIDSLNSRNINMEVIASGGISSMNDLHTLSSINGVVGAITGKAIYEGKLDFKEAIKLLK